MKEFMGEDFLLGSESARRLYFDYAKDMPIIDYHCHVSPGEIWEDKRFEDLSDVWLSGDHYKWRLLRANGVDESFITGSAPAREKLQKFAELMPRAVGNPLYHWCHLELKRYFGYNGILNADTAEEVWQLAKEELQKPGMSARGLIKQSNVRFVGTTDDPIDSLEYHEKLKNDPSFDVTVAPSFRPDKALDIEKPAWNGYIKKLSAAAGTKIDGIDSLEEALKRRMDRFSEMGCRASDHGLNYLVFEESDRSRLDRLVRGAIDGESLSLNEAEAVKTELLLFCAGEYSRRGWVMQMHFNCLRNPNSKMFEAIGPDTGFDCIGPNECVPALSKLLDRLYKTDTLPKLVVYSLDPNDNLALDSLIGSFQQAGIPGKLQHGAAWWFNDTRDGILSQLKSLANAGLLGNFIGMLTDSRSFLSYARHEYFRRILCGLIGGWIENGEAPADFDALGGLVSDICYNNAERFFGLEEKTE